MPYVLSKDVNQTTGRGPQKTDKRPPSQPLVGYASKTCLAGVHKFCYSLKCACGCHS